MYNGVDYPQDYPYYEPTSNSSMNWQNHSSQPGVHPGQQSLPPHSSHLPQNQSQTRFNRFNGHHARDDQDHPSQEFVRNISRTPTIWILFTGYRLSDFKVINYSWRVTVLCTLRLKFGKVPDLQLKLFYTVILSMSLYIADSSRNSMPNHLLFVAFGIWETNRKSKTGIYDIFM